MEVRNKWNGKIYKVKDTTDDNIVLVRQDDTEFTISRAEFNFSYKNVK